MLQPAIESLEDGEIFTASATATDGSNSLNHQGFFNDGGPTNIYNQSRTDRNTALSFVRLD